MSGLNRLAVRETLESASEASSWNSAGKATLFVPCLFCVPRLSLKEKDPRYVIQTYLGMDPDLFQDTGYSQFMGYSKVLRFSDIFVCSEGREDNNFHNMGVCVSMSGNG